MKKEELLLSAIELKWGASYIILVSEYFDPSEVAMESLRNDFKHAGVKDATFVFVRPGLWMLKRCHSEFRGGGGGSRSLEPASCRFSTDRI